MDDTGALRVLFITQHYPPEVAATGQLLAELAEDLAQDGFRPSVLAGRPSYGPLPREAAPTREMRNGVDVVRTLSTRLSRRSPLGRAANWISYPASCFVRGMVGLPRPDVIVGYSAPPTLPPVAYLLARRWRAPFVLYVQDIYPQIAWALGALRNHTLFRGWRALNRGLYRRADLALTLGEHMGATLAREGVTPDRLAVVHNWADGQELRPRPSEESVYRRSLGLADRFVVLYSGNLGRAHDFDPVREALDRLQGRRDRLAFAFFGDGARRPEMEAHVSRSGYQDFVCFHDYVSKDDLLDSLNVGDATLLTVAMGSEGLLVPSKIYAYLAVGRPVIAVCHGSCEVTEIVEGAQCGFVVRSGAELADAVTTLMEDPGLCAEMGRRGRALFEERFDRHHATTRIGVILREVAAGARRG